MHAIKISHQIKDICIHFPLIFCLYEKTVMLHIYICIQDIFKIFEFHFSVK